MLGEPCLLQQHSTKSQPGSMAGLVPQPFLGNIPFWHEKGCVLPAIYTAGQTDPRL